MAYFVGVPLIIAVYAGLNNWEIQHTAGLAASLLFYAAHSFLPWWITCLCTTVIMRLLYTWKPPWVLLLLLGHIAGSLLVTPYSNWLTGIYDLTAAGTTIEHPSTAFFSSDFWVYLTRAGVIWFGVNFLFDRFLGLPLYRYQIPRGYDTPEKITLTENQAMSADWHGKTPGFICRLPKLLQPDEMLAIKAEQHYIKVMTPGKNFMVLYRFSDAINELSSDIGLQVHRSYWINASAIASVNATKLCVSNYPA